MISENGEKRKSAITLQSGDRKNKQIALSVQRQISNVTLAAGFQATPQIAPPWQFNNSERQSGSLEIGDPAN